MSDRCPCGDPIPTVTGLCQACEDAWQGYDKEVATMDLGDLETARQIENELSDAELGEWVSLGCDCGNPDTFVDGFCLDCEVWWSEKHKCWLSWALPEIIDEAQPDVTCVCTPPKQYVCYVCKCSRSKMTDPWKTGTTHTVVGGGSYTYTPKCRHYGQEVVFPDGTRIIASSAHQRSEKDIVEDTARNALPTFGVYMASSWSPGWLAFYLNWADMGLPKVPISDVEHAAREVIRLAQAGTVVEIGCIGGHGRTGTFMACIATLCGLPAADACQWVWTNYCKEAIESEIQEWFVLAFDAHIRGVEPPPKPEPKKTSYTTTSNDQICSKLTHANMWVKHPSVGCTKHMCAEQWWADDVAEFEKGVFPIGFDEKQINMPKPISTGLAGMYGGGML